MVETDGTCCEGVYDPLGLVNLSNACLQMIAEPCNCLCTSIWQNMSVFSISLFTQRVFAESRVISFLCTRVEVAFPFHMTKLLRCCVERLIS